MRPVTLGVDISARWFDIAHSEAVRRFPNTPAGIAGCLNWLAGFGGPVRVGMEATGSYHLPLAAALHGAGHTVLVCNPLTIARYGEAVLARTKTDPADARRIARFCKAHDLAPWSPASPAQQRLHVLVATRQALVRQVQQLRNRQGAAGYTPCAELVAELQAPVLEARAAQIARIDRELADLATAAEEPGPQFRLLTSIPGLGLVTAAALLASLPLDRLTTPRQVAAYAGLCPQERSSGSSTQGAVHAGARRDAGQPDPPRLRRPAAPGGQAPQVIVVAVMRKLLLLAWAIIGSGRPYSPTHRSAGPATAVA